MFESFSLLRFLGLLTGSINLFIALYKLRSFASSRVDVWLLTISGFALVGISLFPSLVDFPRDILSLGNVQGGRIIALLFLLVLFMFPLLFRLYFHNQSVNNQLSTLISYISLQEFSDKPLAHCPNAVLVIIPALNESENLKVVLPEIPKAVKGQKIYTLVVDDGSTDATYTVARDLGAMVVAHPLNRGGGAALRTGFQMAQKHQIEYAITMDADGQHNPVCIEQLIQPILADEADIVIGSRTLGSSEDYSNIRMAGVHFFNALISALMGTKITDCASGFRAFKISALTQLNLHQDQYHTTELIIEAIKHRLRIVERPIRISKRYSGSSKKGTTFKYAFQFFKTLIRIWWR